MLFCKLHHLFVRLENIVICMELHAIEMLNGFVVVGEDEPVSVDLFEHDVCFEFGPKLV